VLGEQHEGSYLNISQLAPPPLIFSPTSQTRPLFAGVVLQNLSSHRSCHYLSEIYPSKLSEAVTVWLVLGRGGVD